MSFDNGCTEITVWRKSKELFWHMSTVQRIETVAFLKCCHTRICIHILVFFSDLVLLFNLFVTLGFLFLSSKSRCWYLLCWRQVNYFNSLNAWIGNDYINLLLMLYKILGTFFFPTQRHLFTLLEKTKYLFNLLLFRTCCLQELSTSIFEHTDRVCLPVCTLFSAFVDVSITGLL